MTTLPIIAGAAQRFAQIEEKLKVSVSRILRRKDLPAITLILVMMQ